MSFQWRPNDFCHGNGWGWLFNMHFGREKHNLRIINKFVKTLRWLYNNIIITLYKYNNFKLIFKLTIKKEKMPKVLLKFILFLNC